MPLAQPVSSAALHVRQQQGAPVSMWARQTSNRRPRETLSRRHHSWEWNAWFRPRLLRVHKRGLRIMWRRQGSTCESGSWTRPPCTPRYSHLQVSHTFLPYWLAGPCHLPIQRFSKFHSVMIECGHPHFASPSTCSSGQEPGRVFHRTGTRRFP